jgi:alpha-tubulin suppressor-like RCC1 family protein
MESSYVLLTFMTEIVQDTTTESVKQMTEWNVMVGALTKVWMAQRLEALKDSVIKMMALGSEHSLALSEEGQVLSWGASLHGRLGHGHGYNPSMFSIFRTMSEYTPRLVQHLQNVKVQKIAAGLMHSACLDGVPSSSDLCYSCMNVPLLRR